MKRDYGKSERLPRTKFSAIRLVPSVLTKAIRGERSGQSIENQAMDPFAKPGVGDKPPFVEFLDAGGG
jgi:hypothetical protein